MLFFGKLLALCLEEEHEMSKGFLLTTLSELRRTWMISFEFKLASQVAATFTQT